MHRPDWMAKRVESLSTAFLDCGIVTHRFDSWSSQTNDIQFDTCRFQDSRSALFGYSKDWCG